MRERFEFASLLMVLAGIAVAGSGCAREGLPRVDVRPPEWWRTAVLTPAEPEGDPFDLAESCRAWGELPESLRIESWESLVDSWRASDSRYANGAVFERAYGQALRETRKEITALLHKFYRYRKAKDFNAITQGFGQKLHKSTFELRHIAERMLPGVDSSPEKVCARGFYGYFYAAWIRAVDPLSRWVEDAQGSEQAQGARATQEIASAEFTPSFEWRWVRRGFGAALIVRWQPGWNGVWTAETHERWSELLREIRDVTQEQLEEEIELDTEHSAAERAMQWVWDLRAMPESAPGAWDGLAAEAFRTLPGRQRSWFWLPAHLQASAGVEGASRAIPRWITDWSAERLVAYARPICEVRLPELFPGKRWVRACGPTPLGIRVREASAVVSKDSTAESLRPDVWNEPLARELAEH